MRPNSEMPVALTVTSDPCSAPAGGASLEIASVSTGFRTTTTSDACARGADDPPSASQPHTSHDPALENVVLNACEKLPETALPLPPSWMPLSGLAVDVHELPPAGRRRVFAYRICEVSSEPDIVIDTDVPATGWAGDALIASEALSVRIEIGCAALAVAGELEVGASQLQKR